MFYFQSSATSAPATTLDGLPKKFVVAMRTLFDIMDDKRIGYVSYTGTVFFFDSIFNF